MVLGYMYDTRGHFGEALNRQQESVIWISNISGKLYNNSLLLFFLVVLERGGRGRVGAGWGFGLW